MAGKLYLNALAAAFNGEIDYDTHTIKMALLTSAYTPNQDSHDYWDDVSAFEASGTGYTAGGQALTGKTVTKDAPNNVVILDSADVTWANSAITARYGVVYDDTPATAATKPLIGYVDFTTDQTSTDGNFLVEWSAQGILRISVE